MFEIRSEWQDHAHHGKIFVLIMGNNGEYVNCAVSEDSMKNSLKIEMVLKTSIYEMIRKLFPDHKLDEMKENLEELESTRKYLINEISNLEDEKNERMQTSNEKIHEENGKKDHEERS